MADRDTLSMIVEEVSLVLQPLSVALSSPDYFNSFMRVLGWDVTGPIAPIDELGSLTTDVLNAVEGGIDLTQVPAVIGKWSSWLEAVDNLENIANSALPATIDAAEFKREFPKQLVDFLIGDYLLRHHPVIGSALAMGGVLRIQEVDATGSRLAYYRYEIRWDKIGDLLNDPLSAFRSTYNWGESAFDGATLTHNLDRLGQALGLIVFSRPVDSAIESALNQNAAATTELQAFTLRWQLLGNEIGAHEAKVGLDWFILPEIPTAKPGFAILPYATGLLENSFELSEALSLALKAAFEFSGGVALSVRPSGVDLEANLTGGAPEVATEFTATLAYHDPDTGKTILLGTENGSRFEFGTASFTVGARMHGDNRNAYAELGFPDLALVINPGIDADGFLANLLPEQIDAQANITIGIDSETGLYFSGSGGLEIQLPLHLELGPIEIMALSIAVRITPEGIPTELGATLKGNLGPLQAVIENVGLRATLSFPPVGGNLGPLDLEFGFKPPNGVGLSLDVGVFKGGGYLFIDPERGEYAGALELTFSGFLSLKAIGIITTRMPDGSDGFSLLIIITAEFIPGIQLSYGFTLIGVGGLLGLNRTVVLNALATGVRTGAVNGILFPVDPVANAPRIISDLRTIFPPFEGHFLIGPMAKIGWGTPTLISLALGLIIEIPGNIAILGILKVALPIEQAPLIQLQVNFIGAIEFDKKRAWFFAALYESRVVFITLEGEMGVLAAFGDDANLLLSVGGFHPRYSPPPLPFPSPRRIAFDVINTPVARIRAEGYFAVTTNTVQFGARAELFFGLSELSVEADVAFDALLRFSPFYFIIELTASASAKAFGIGLFSIDLEFTLEGVTPWRARGRGSVELLLGDLSADFDKTWGESRDTTQPPIRILPMLREEFGKASNWRALPPPSHNLLVSLRKLELAADALVLHPLGTLEISQSALPLGITLDKIGAQKLADAKRVSVDVIGGGGLARRSDARRGFAPAQFRNLSDAQKLAAPAFQQEVSGLSLGVDGAELRTGRAVKRSLRYEVTTIDTYYRRLKLRFSKLGRGLFGHWIKGAAVSKSAIALAQRKQAQPFDDRIQVVAEEFAVVSIENNKAASQNPAFATEAAAREWMQDTVARDPNLAQKLQVVPFTEISKAA